MEVTLMDVVARKTPTWNRVGCPPVSLGEAMNTAEGYVATFIDSANERVELSDVSLNCFAPERYFYVVPIIIIPKSGKHDGMIPTVNVVVLMDGTVVKYVEVK